MANPLLPKPTASRRLRAPAATRFFGGLTEHDLQVQCITWFRFQYPRLSRLLFAIPNGGQRNKATAGRLRAEGVTAGVADLFLSIPKYAGDGCSPIKTQFHGLYLECKLLHGRQSAEQKEFEIEVTKQGYQYSIFRSLPEFQLIINKYFQNEQP